MASQIAPVCSILYIEGNLKLSNCQILLDVIPWHIYNEKALLKAKNQLLLVGKINNCYYAIMAT